MCRLLRKAIATRPTLAEELFKAAVRPGRSRDFARNRDISPTFLEHAILPAQVVAKWASLDYVIHLTEMMGRML